ncbi:MAG: site-specific integrase [Rikenellaceae bacterium]|nr:site-specific integrase [Rikenellaceae bacterium]
MATIKVKLRNSSLPGKAGTICYQITHQRKTRQIATRIRIAPGDWLATEQRIAPEAFATPGGRLLQRRIESDVARLCGIVKALDVRGESYRPEDVVVHFRSPEQCVTIGSVMQQEIAGLIRNHRLGTARNYRRTLNSFMTFLQHDDIPVSDITESLIDDYNSFLLARGIVRNSISFYMRILRAAYNKAVRKYRIEQTYPFQRVYTGIDRTRKRAIDERFIARLWQLDLTDAPSLLLARDLFIFSYCARGMAFVDMAYLQTKDIRSGEIVYMRRKTGQQLCVRIEPCMWEIIGRHAEASHASYLFPILSAAEPDKAFAQYEMALNRYNQQLKRLGKRLQLQQPLSSYTARHSWATAARKHKVPLPVISAGMGHTSERTTQIYLALLENSVIDTANGKITAALNKRVSGGPCTPEEGGART